MVFPHVAGILFTADPVTSTARSPRWRPSFGLGEALVSGLVNADATRCATATVVAKAVATKRLAIRPAGGGTQERAIDPLGRSSRR